MAYGVGVLLYFAPASVFISEVVLKFNILVFDFPFRQKRPNILLNNQTSIIKAALCATSPYWTDPTMWGSPLRNRRGFFHDII